MLEILKFVYKYNLKGEKPKQVYIIKGLGLSKPTVSSKIKGGYENMKIEINTEEWMGFPVLIKPSTKMYASNNNFPSWDITYINLLFDKSDTEENNKIQANNLSDLVIDLCDVKQWARNDKEQFFNWVKESLRQKLELGEPAISQDCVYNE